MQEDTERRSIAITLTASKLTAKGLAKALMAALRKIQQTHREAQTPDGRQSVKKLMNHNVNTNSIPLDGETRLFDRVARKWNVDYAFKKTEPGKYLLFFKAGQADVITACFSEYPKQMMRRKKENRPSIQAQLKHYGEQVRQRPRERELKREVVRDDR